RNSPQNARSCPGHAFKNLAPADAAAGLFIVVAVISHRVISYDVEGRLRGLDRQKRCFIPGIEKKWNGAEYGTARRRSKGRPLAMILLISLNLCRLGRAGGPCG